MDRKKKWMETFNSIIALYSLWLCHYLKVRQGCGRTAAEVPSAEGTEEGSSTEETESSVAAMGRYMESTTPLPDGADSEGRTMTMLSDNRLAYFDAAAGLLYLKMRGKAGALRKHTVILFPRMGL